MNKPWWKSRAKGAGVAAIALFVVSFFVGVFRGGPVMEAAEQAAEVVAVFSPILAGFAVIGVRGALSVLLVMGLGLGVGACATDGASKVQPATATTTTGTVAQTARDQETAGGTYMGIGGDTIYNIHPKPGITIPEKVSDAVAKVIAEEGVSVETKTLFINAMGRMYGFTCTIEVDDSPQGNVDLAGTTGKTAIPSETEPDKPKKTEGDGQ